MIRFLMMLGMGYFLWKNLKDAPVRPPRAARRSAAMPVVDPAPDNLTKIDGIGPKTARVLVSAGLVTYARLADTEAERLRVILSAAGLPAFIDPASWPAQARLAARGQWDALTALQATLRAEDDA